MATKTKRAAIYLRVSTDGQTTENQRLALEAIAAQRGWQVVATFEDAGISGSKGRDGRPGLDAMLKGASKAKFDVVMAWAVDRLGRSLVDLLGMLSDLDGAKVDLFLHQQNLDTTTPAGRAFFQMTGVFAEFERSMIQSRVKAGMDRAKAEQDAGKVRKDAQGRTKKAIGRPVVAVATETAIRDRLLAGVGILKVAREIGVGTSTVQRVKRQMAEAA